MNLKWLFPILLQMLSSVAAAQPVEVGWMESIDGDAGKVRIVRQGRTLPAAVLLPLQQDDLIYLDAARVVVHLQLGSQRVVVKHADSPFTVRREDHSVSIPGRLLDWASSLLADGAGNRLLRTVSAVSRGTGLQAPLLGYFSKTVTQRDTLELAWHSGVPPFRVKLIAMSSSTTLRLVDDIQVRTLTLDIPDLEPGRYQLELSDSGNNNRYLIEIIPPQDRFYTAYQPAVGDTLTALELLREDSETWLLEAYQLVSEHAQNYPPARVIRDSLR